MEGVKPRQSSPQDWEQLYRKLDVRHRRFLKRYDEIQGQMQQYRHQAYILEADLRTIRPEVYQADRKIDRLEQRIEKLEAENDALRKQLAGVKQNLDQQTRPVPAFVKANVAQKGKKRPGRKAGHEAALRPMPEKIDQHIEVAAPTDAGGIPSCPHCHTQLSDVQQHQRIVEDIVPSKPLVSCYHTTSGYCPGCRQRPMFRTVRWGSMPWRWRG